MALNMRRLTGRLALAGFAALVMGGRPAHSQTVEEFYRGKQMRIVVGSAAGGGYDAYARTVAAHMGKHIPGNPTFIVQNMPGVGSLIAVNHVVNVAPKDGTVMAAMHPAGVIAPLFHPEQAKFDSRRLNWLGSPVTITFTVVVSNRSPVQTFDQLFTTELIVAASGGDSTTLPLLTNGVLGTKFKVITGYKSASASMLAIERGEAQGNGGDALSALKSVHADYLKDGRLRIIASYGLRANPELVGVPMVIDYAKTANQRAALKLVLSGQDLGWPYVMAPDVPPDRVKAMQAAFDATMQDPDFLADAAKRRLDISPIRGESQASQVIETFKTPRDVIENVKRITGE
jgi:tripartite-type tricarboxylate transporter receptor subunit TctC